MLILIYTLGDLLVMFSYVGGRLHRCQRSNIPRSGPRVSISITHNPFFYPAQGMGNEAQLNQKPNQITALSPTLD